MFLFGWLSCTVGAKQYALFLCFDTPPYTKLSIFVVVFIFRTYRKKRSQNRIEKNRSILRLKYNYRGS